MRWGESRTVALKSIVGPGDVARRQATGEVIELAATVREFGDEPINPLTVMKVRKGWQLIAGRDRYSALALAGIKSAPVRVVEDATPQELHDMEVVENLNRRVDDRNKLIAERTRKVAESIRSARSEAGQLSGITASKAGAQKTVEGEARERVAASLGTTAEAVRKAEARAKVREEQAAGNLDVGGRVEEPPPAPIETFGHELPEHVRDRVAATLTVLEAIDKAHRRTEHEALNRASECVPAVEIDNVRRALIEATGAIQQAMPTHLCPYCLGVLAKRGTQECAGCKGHGYVTRSVFESAPAELRENQTKETIDGEEESGSSDPGTVHADPEGCVRPVRSEHAAALRRAEVAGDGGAPGNQAGAGSRGGTRHELRPDADVEGARGPGLAAGRTPPKKLRGVRIQIGDGPEMTAEQAEAFLAAAPPMNSDDERTDVDEEGIPF